MSSSCRGERLACPARAEAKTPLSSVHPEGLPLLTKTPLSKLRALRAVVTAVLLAIVCFAADGAKSPFHRRDLVFQNYIDDADLSPDGTRLAVVLEEPAGKDAHSPRVELWDFSTHKLAEKTFPVTWRGLPQVRLRFSGDGKFLLFCDGKDELHVLDEYLHDVRQLDIGLSSGDIGKLNELAAAANPSRIEPLPVRSAVVEEMAVAPVGSLVAVRFLVREFSQLVRVFDFKSGAMVHSWGQAAVHSGPGTLVAWDPSGQRLALGFDSEIVRERQPGDVLIYSAKSGGVTQFLRSGLGGVSSLAFAGDGHLVVAPASTPRGVLPALHGISLAAGEQQTLTVPETGLRAPFAVTLDGKTLVALAERLGTDPGDSSILRPLDTRYAVWDLSEEAPMAITPDLWPVKAPSVAVSADGRRFLMARHYDSRRVVLLELNVK